MTYPRKRLSYQYRMNKKEITKAAAVLGSLGGKAGTGIAKARSSEQARKAALIGAAKRKAAK